MYHSKQHLQTVTIITMQITDTTVVYSAAMVMYYNYYYYNTHLMAFFSRTSCVSGYQKGKTSVDLK